MMGFYELVQEGEELVDYIKSKKKKIILYGIGSIGNFVYGVLKSKVNVEAYCTSGEVETPMLNGLPVYCIRELPFGVDECLFLLTMDSRHWNDVMKTLEQVEAQHVLPISTKKQSGLLAMFYEAFFKANGVDMKNDLIEIAGTLMASPLTVDGEDLDAVLVEMNDLMLGDICGDYSMATDGPYLYQQCRLNSGDVVFDCGANLGLFACHAASKGCTAYAFEPTKRLCNKLEFYKEVYGGKFVPVNAALSDENGEAVFFCGIWV